MRQPHLLLQVSPKMRVEELRNVIRDKGGILPALQRLSYAGAPLRVPVQQTTAVRP